ncbi:hypothetical protein FS749_014596 [Ceratobasidium sp. UAMH 11750]|nr:hypothetical protein FS749_014596 [Ceratobasidium sp. UAMH 11750]
MWVYAERQRLFSEGEFLIADGGYPLSPYVLIPFAKNELNVDRKRRREFNRKLSKARIVIEWTFGKLKARFPALTKLGAVRDMRDIYRAIEAMMVVHNICHDLGDVPDFSRVQVNDGEEEESDEEANEEDQNYNLAIDEQNLLRGGWALRQRCVDIICP